MSRQICQIFEICKAVFIQNGVQLKTFEKCSDVILGFVQGALGNCAYHTVREEYAIG